MRDSGEHARCVARGGRVCTFRRGAVDDDGEPSRRSLDEGSNPRTFLRSRHSVRVARHELVCIAQAQFARRVTHEVGEHLRRTLASCARQDQGSGRSHFTTHVDAEFAAPRGEHRHDGDLSCVAAGVLFRNFAAEHLVGHRVEHRDLRRVRALGVRPATLEPGLNQTPNRFTQRTFVGVVFCLRRNERDAVDGQHGSAPEHETELEHT